MPVTNALITRHNGHRIKAEQNIPSVVHEHLTNSKEIAINAGITGLL